MGPARRWAGPEAAAASGVLPVDSPMRPQRKAGARSRRRRVCWTRHASHAADWKNVPDTARLPPPTPPHLHVGLCSSIPPLDRHIRSRLPLGRRGSPARVEGGLRRRRAAPRARGLAAEQDGPPARLATTVRGASSACRPLEEGTDEERAWTGATAACGKGTAGLAACCRAEAVRWAPGARCESRIVRSAGWRGVRHAEAVRQDMILPFCPKKICNRHSVTQDQLLAAPLSACSSLQGLNRLCATNSRHPSHHAAVCMCSKKNSGTEGCSYKCFAGVCCSTGASSYPNP